MYLHEKIGGEGDHEHAEPTDGVHLARRGTSHDAVKLLRTVLGRDDRARTVMQTAADVDRAHLPEPVRELLDTHERTKAACRTEYRRHVGGQAAERELAAVLPGLRAQVGLLETAGGISGAGGYYTRAEMFTEVGEAHRTAVAALAHDLHAVQILTIHPDAAQEKAAPFGRSPRPPVNIRAD